VPPLLLHASDAVLHSELAGNTAVAAALASALSSLIKRTVQLVRASAVLRKSEAAAATVQGHAAAAAAYFPAAVRSVVGDMQHLAGSLGQAIEGKSNASLSSQAAASAALLAVVLARGLVQVADAMETAGPQQYHKCVVSKPAYSKMWQSYDAATCQTVYFSRMIEPAGGEEHQSIEVQWQYWQASVLEATQPLLAGLRKLGMAPAAAAAERAAAQIDVGPDTEQLTSRCLTDQGSSTSSRQAGSIIAPAASQCSSSSCSNSTPQVKWCYLLHLQHLSPHWAAAAAAFTAKWPNSEELPAPAADAEQLGQLYDDVVGLCRALLDAAPITVVCNNPSCESLADVSEAAASCKACPGCRCRYCSAACYKVDWKRHKPACKQLAAAGCACIS
jgi:hypothetical protein